jgi:putative intracellular protease/amidase
VALVIPGGRAPEYIRNDPDVQRIVRHFMEADQPVTQLCHGPLVLAAAGTLSGRRTAAYPALAPDIAAAGAQFVDSAATVDGQMVSARACPDRPGARPPDPRPAWSPATFHLCRTPIRGETVTGMVISDGKSGDAST